MVKKTLLILVVFLFIYAGCQGQDASSRENIEKAIIVNVSDNPVLTFAAEELTMFVKEASDTDFVESQENGHGIRFVFNVNKDLEAYSWAVAKKNNVIELAGHDETCVLHAVYTLLEKLGYRFEITGPVTPEKIDFDGLDSFSEIIKPAIAKRGIRFHMNFPQDISSFPIEEAKEYIKNTARMRMNQHTFHSYPGRLYNGVYGSKMWWAGRTYEERMELPENDPLFSENIRNKRFYRIPELEGYDDRPEQRAKLMKQWTRQVFEQIKTCGIYLQVSFEPRLEPENHVLNMFEDIYTSYPMIDAIELMTEENGGGAPEDPEVMRKALQECFDAEELMDHPRLKDYLATRNEDRLVDMVREIAHNTVMAKKIRQAFPKAANNLDFVIGVYVSKDGYNNLAAILLERFVPKEFQTAQMPQYGSRWVAQRFANEMSWLPASEWDRKIVYSWYEFDGLFFLQQMACDGIYDIVKLAMKGATNGQGNAVLFNIWTSAKNRTSVRYGSLATIYGPISAHEFYKNYAVQMGIKEQEKFAAAMKAIDLANEAARQTWNIGFGCGALWIGWWPGQMQAWFDKNSKVDDVQAVYEDILKQVQSLSSKTADGQWFLDYLENQLKCSVLHYQAVSRVRPIFHYLTRNGEALDGKNLTDEQRTEIREACKDATYYCNKYMKTYADKIAERGDEGALLNYYYCMPQFLLMVQSKYVGDKNAKPVPIEITDMWPPPAKWD
jgi:hypothetical protein